MRIHIMMGIVFGVLQSRFSFPDNVTFDEVSKDARDLIKRWVFTSYSLFSCTQTTNKDGGRIIYL